MAEKPKTLIFDFDGTIADSFQVIIEIFEEVTDRKTPLDTPEMAHLRGLPITEVARRLKVPLWRTPLLLLKGRALMQKRIAEIKPFVDLPEALATFSTEGHKIYIISSNSSLNIHKFLRANELNHLIDGVYGGISLFGKAKAMKKLFQRYKLNPQNCLYIGDETRDIEASREVGLPCVAVAWGFAQTDFLEQLHPTALAKAPEDLTTLIAKL